MLNNTAHLSKKKEMMLPNFHLWNWKLWTMKNGEGNKGAFIKIMMLFLGTAGPQWQYNGTYIGFMAIFSLGFPVLLAPW